MSRKCLINNCKSFDGECAFFGVPKASVDTWTKIVSTINGHDTKVKFVCEKHFLPKDIIKNYAAEVKVCIHLIIGFLKMSSIERNINYKLNKFRT